MKHHAHFQTPKTAFQIKQSSNKTDSFSDILLMKIFSSISRIFIKWQRFAVYQRFIENYNPFAAGEWNMTHPVSIMDQSFTYIIYIRKFAVRTYFEWGKVDVSLIHERSVMHKKQCLIVGDSIYLMFIQVIKIDGTSKSTNIAKTIYRYYNNPCNGGKFFFES